MFIRRRAFFYKQYFHDEIHVFFFQCDYNFCDLALRHAYLSIYCTSCIQNYHTALVTDTLSSALVATTRLTILARLVYDNKTTEILCKFQVVENLSFIVLTTHKQIICYHAMSNECYEKHPLLTALKSIFFRSFLATAEKYFIKAIDHTFLGFLRL